MAELTFSQTERRSILVPALIAVVVIGTIAALAFFYLPRHTADAAVTHVAILPTHTAFKTDSKVVGHVDPSEDDLYVLATVRVDNHLHVPLFLKDITATLTSADDSVTTTSAVEERDLASLYTTFPALKPLASVPLARESAIDPRGHGEGMVLLHFPIPQSLWDQRKGATITLDFYHQGSLTIPIPKS
jgi:hypothetical protein